MKYKYFLICKETAYLEFFRTKFMAMRRLKKLSVGNLHYYIKNAETQKIIASNDLNSPEIS